jgi:FkbM family methyltransferase
MANAVIRLAHRLGRSMGVDVVRYQPTSHPLARRMQLMRSYRIGLVLDVGANGGQYARELRELGYAGRIVSFEPLPEAATRLVRASAGDERWDTRAVALGDVEGVMPMNIAGRSASSSLLEMLPDHERYAPGTANIGVIDVNVVRLDDIAAELSLDSQRTLLKIDTQGYEAKVIEGATATLERLTGLQVELSTVPLYEGAPLAADLILDLDARGFALMGIEPGFSDAETGRMLQFDGLFYRPQAAADT